MDYKVDGADHFCGMCGCWIGNHDSGITPYGAASYYQIRDFPALRDVKTAAFSYSSQTSVSEGITQPPKFQSCFLLAGSR